MTLHKSFFYFFIGTTLLFLSIGMSVFGQVCFEQPDMSPAADDFNWVTGEPGGETSIAPNGIRKTEYRIVYRDGNGIDRNELVISPFSASNICENESNVSLLYAPPIDYFPEDGWVLLKRSFGTVERPVRTPYLILYNKFTAKLRFFALITMDYQNIQNLNVKLWFNPDMTYNSAVLAHVDQFKLSLDNFRTPNGLCLNVINEGCTQGKYWVHADFQMDFDPCTCLLPSTESKLSFDVVKNETGTLNLTIRGEAAQKFLQANGQGGIKGEKGSQETQGISLDQLGQAAKAGITAYQKGEKTKKEVDKVIKDMKDGKYKKLLEDSKEVLSLASKLTVGIPFVSAAIGIVDFFISGGKKKEETKTQVQPSIFHIDLKAEGTLSSESLHERISISLPGSDKRFEDVGVFGTVYNEPLGVINLLEAPVIEYVDYYNTGKDYCEVNPMDDLPYGMYYGDYGSMPIIRQFNAKEDLKLLVNPSLGLEILDQHAYVFIRYTTKEKFNTEINFMNQPFSPVASLPSPNLGLNGNFNVVNHYDPNLTFEERLTATGLEVEYYDKQYDVPLIKGEMRLRTHVLPFNCFKQHSFSLMGGKSQSNFFNQEVFSFPADYFPEIYVKIIVRLKRSDDPNALPILYAATYKPNIIKSNLWKSKEDAVDLPNYHYGWGGGFNCYQDDPFNDGTFLFRIYGPNNPLLFNPYYRLPVNLIFDQPMNVFTGNYYATNKILIKEGFSAPLNGDYTFTAGNEVNVTPNVSVLHNSHLRIGKAPGLTCTEQLVLPQSSDVINAFCRSKAKYKPKNEIIGIQNREKPEFEQSVVSLTLSAYPNPTTGEVWLKAENGASADATAEILDVTGRVVLPARAISISAGVSSEPLDVSALASGIYLLKITTGGTSSVSKLIIRKD